MKRHFWKIAILMLLMIVFFIGCGSDVNQATKPEQVMVETTEPEIEPDLEWLSEAAIDEAYACLFPTDGDKNIELAQEILLPLVEAGNAEAMYYWGYIYDWEIVDNNGEAEKESLYWHTLAFEQGFPKSYLAAALNEYIESEERANELVEKAKQAGLFDMTTEELGADGCELIGSYYHKKNDYPAAMEWFLKSSDMGSSAAMRYIAHMYNNAHGVKKDIATYLDWSIKAANLGDVYAMYDVGNFLLHSDIDPIGYYSSKSEMLEAAAKWYQKAAEAGHAGAMNQLGYCYYSGFGVEINTKEALNWFQKGANAGNAAAMYWIGWLKINTAREPNDGMAWCMKAYANGEATVAEYINTLLDQQCGVNGYFENYGELISSKP